MWDRMSDPEEMQRVIRQLWCEVSEMRRDMVEVLRECREAQFVRMRLERERPGYWDDSVRLGMVQKRIGDAL